MSSDKENMPPTESVTPPSLRNLSLEEEANKPENKATSWEANVARNVETIPGESSPYPRKTSTLEDLELDTDEDIIDVTDYSERPSNDKRSPRPKQTDLTQGHCPTPQKQPPHILAMNMLQQQHLSSLIETEILGDPPIQEKSTLWMASMF